MLQSRSNSIFVQNFLEIDLGVTVSLSNNNDRASAKTYKNGQSTIRSVDSSMLSLAELPTLLYV